MRGPLGNEVRQSVSLIVLTVTSMAVYVALGLLAVRLLG
jgi:hypothetical protein